MGAAVTGTMTANGHQPPEGTLRLPVLPLRMPPGGLVPQWPLTPGRPAPEPSCGPPDDTSATPPAAADNDTVTPPARRRRLPAVRWHAPGGDTVITWAMTSAAGLVILFAAIVSYSHIHALATTHREDWMQSHLLPLSIDGVIAEASLVMLFAARHKPMRTPPLARVMLWAGIIATLGANALVALPPQWISPVASAVIGAVLSAWPAAAFIGSVELVMRLVRDVRAVNSDDIADDSDGDTASHGDEDTAPDSDDDKGDSGNDKPKPPKPARTARGKTDAVTAEIKRHPDWADDKIAAKTGVSTRTVKRRRAKLRNAGTAPAA